MFEDWVAALAGRPVGSDRPVLCDELAGLGRLRSALDAREARLLAAVDGLGDRGAPASTVARSLSRCSQREADRRARRAAVLAELPDAADALAHGALSVEHVDTLGRAVEATSAREVAASGLIDAATRRPADLHAKDGRDWIRRHQTETEVAEQQRRRHAARRLSMWDNVEGMTVLYGEFDPVAGQRIRTAVEAEANRLFHADGGRDGAGEVRTPEQRRADALTGLLTGTADRSSATSAPVRHQLLVLATIDGGAPSDGRLVDGTPLPRSVLERVACGSDLWGLVFDGGNEPLWHGRQVRLATDAQWRALIARDGGCRICDADPSRCEAHHLVAWQPPGHGPTDITNLILLCSHHHHVVHDLGWRLVRHDDGHHDGHYAIEPP